MPEVVVSAPRFASEASTLPYGVSVITREELAGSGAATVNEALMRLLGVPGRADYYGGGEYNLDLRGFGTTAGSNQVVVLDGIRLNEVDLGGTRLSGLSVNDVERIEVLRGSGAVLYGEAATAGVIVITTRAGQGTARRNAAAVEAQAGSYGFRSARGSATLVAGGFSMDVSAGERRSDNHRDNFHSDQKANRVQVQWSNDWLRLGLGHAQDDLETGLPGAISLAQFAANPTQVTAFNTQTTAQIANRRDTLMLQAEMGAWQLALDAGQRSKQLDSLNKGVSTYLYDIDASSLALRARHSARWGQMANALTLGVDDQRWESTVPGGFGSVAGQTSRAAYAQN